MAWLAGHGRLDIPRQLLTLGPLPAGLALGELGHDLGREQLEALTNVIVAILAALLDEDGLVDASILDCKHANHAPSLDGLPPRALSTGDCLHGSSCGRGGCGLDEPNRSSLPGGVPTA